MARRSRAREVALQLLFQHDFNPRVKREVIERFVRERLRDDTLEEFCLRLYDGVIDKRAHLDEQLKGAAQNWRLERMAVVDRNILRLGSYEVLHTTDVPASVALNEAIELARRYGNTHSASFVNGILDRLCQDASTS